MANKKIVSLGLDLSLTGTGVIILEDGKIIKQHLIKSKPVGDLPLHELKRIRKIVEEIEIIVSENEIDIAVIEGIAYGVRNATALVQLSALNYMCRSVLFDYNIPFIIVYPTSLKKFVTGKGNAQKDQMMMDVYKNWNFTSLDSNIADAFGLAKIGQFMLDFKIKVNQQQKECLELLKKQI